MTPELVEEERMRRPVLGLGPRLNKRLRNDEMSELDPQLSEAQKPNDRGFAGPHADLITGRI